MRIENWEVRQDLSGEIVLQFEDDPDEYTIPFDVAVRIATYIIGVLEAK